MTLFERRISNICKRGAICSIKIGVSSLRAIYLQKEGYSIPEEMTVMSLLDTGASHTVITTGLLDKLNIKPIEFVHISSTTHSNVLKPRYDVNITFESHNRIIEDVLIIESNLRKGEYQCLIGRDILKNMLLIYNGITNCFTLCD
ncbi:MAG: aspartyl protease family protein [Candidatus Hatepunaea meridiana]|nr:aspartyl protease family protein [Candidatus Hatepunaea meridiana]